MIQNNAQKFMYDQTQLRWLKFMIFFSHGVNLGDYGFSPTN